MWAGPRRQRIRNTFLSLLKVTQHAAWWSDESKYSKPKKNIEIQLVRPTEVCGEVLSETNAYK